VVLSVDSRNSALTWSMGAVSTHEQQDFDKMTDVTARPDGVVATGAVLITTRDMSLLADLAGVVASVDPLHVDLVTWHVDNENPAWREIRADAIAAAIVKGRDYAAALGGAVTKVEHVADPGLLSSGDGHSAIRAFQHSAAAVGAETDTDTPLLDPVPQEIVAVVEARLVAEVAPLG
jgi:uncharacterized protein YggE